MCRWWRPSPKCMRYSGWAPPKILQRSPPSCSLRRLTGSRARSSVSTAVAEHCEPRAETAPVKTLRLVLGDQLCRTISALRAWITPAMLCSWPRCTMKPRMCGITSRSLSWCSRRCVILPHPFVPKACAWTTSNLMTKAIRLVHRRTRPGALTSSCGPYRCHAAGRVARVGNDAGLGRGIRHAG